ncbi:hypothetical protein WN943_008586 [Citrus x changshan-huyou]
MTKNIVVDAIPLTTIHATTSDVGSCELKEEIDEDSSVYVDEIIKRREVINLENSEDEDEPVVEDTYPWQMKTIKCGLGEMSLEILMIRYSIPRSITLRRASPRRNITNPPKGFVGITRCMLNSGVRLPFHPYVRRILHALGLAPAQLSPKAWCCIIGMWSLWRYLGFNDPSVGEFQNLFHPQRCPKAEGFWCLSAYPNSDKILLYGEPSRQDKTWKPYHFLIKGNWEFGTSTEHPEAIIQTRFCQPNEWICPDLSVDEERNIAEALSLSLGKRSISAACSEETLVERGIIPSISFSEKEASVMASNNSPNATFKGEKRKRLVIPNVAQKKQQKQGGSSSQSVSQAQQITPLIPPLLPPLPSDKGTCIIAPQNPLVHQLSSSTLMKDIESLDPVESLKLASSLLSKNLVSLSTSEERAKTAEKKVQELSLQLSKTIEYNSEMQRSLDDAKAKERAALDKANAEMEKVKGLEKDLSAAKGQIESILDQGYEEYLKGLKDCRMFFACYNADADIEVVDQHLKELGVKFDEHKPNEDNGSKTCIDGGGTDGTRDTHLTEEISTVIPEGFEDLFGTHPEQQNDDTRNF